MTRVYIGFRAYDPSRRRTANLRGFSIRAEGFPSAVHVRQVIIDALLAEAERLRHLKGVAHDSRSSDDSAGLARIETDQGDRGL